MHDLAAAGDIVDAALRVASENGGVRLRRIHLVLGAKSHIDPDSLRAAFEIVASTTEAAGVELEIEKPPAHCRCRVCGRTFDSPRWPTRCACESLEVFSEDSADLAITAIDVDEALPVAEADCQPS